jgi:UDP-N-acetylglucosamine:LPS N-acetylglucosamine transferase
VYHTPHPKTQLDALVFSADVGAGHDAIAAAWIREQQAVDPGYTAVVVNGLAAMGPRMHRATRDGYAAQLDHAPWVWTLQFKLFGTRLLAPIAYWLLPFLFARRLGKVIAEHQPELVVSTYPLCTSVTAGLRRTGRLDVPLVAIIGDVNPHRIWFAPGVDEHVVASAADKARATRLVPWATVTHHAPAVDPRFRACARARRACSSSSRSILVSGGSWGAGNITGIVERLRTTRPNDRLVVVCGTNDDLRSDLTERYGDAATIIGFTTVLPELMDAADVLVATGPGMTLFEAAASSLPIVMAGLIPGHGRRSAAGAHADGMARWARTLDELELRIDEALAPPVFAPSPVRPASMRKGHAMALAVATTTGLLALTGMLPISAFAHDMRTVAHYAGTPIRTHVHLDVASRHGVRA